MQEHKGRPKGADLLVYSASIRLFSLVSPGYTRDTKTFTTLAEPNLSSAILIGKSFLCEHNTTVAFMRSSALF